MQGTLDSLGVRADGRPGRPQYPILGALPSPSPVRELLAAGPPLLPRPCITSHPPGAAWTHRRHSRKMTKELVLVPEGPLRAGQVGRCRVFCLGAERQKDTYTS